MEKPLYWEKRNEIIFEQAKDLYLNRLNKDKLSFDVNDFDISFMRGLSFEDGVTTLTDFTAEIIAEELNHLIFDKSKNLKNILVCGGGRKNKVLMSKIENTLQRNLKLRLIDEFNIDGDFIESQAFGYLAIRSYKNLPLSFPNTTGCRTPCTGGILIDN